MSVESVESNETLDVYLQPQEKLSVNWNGRTVSFTIKYRNNITPLSASIDENEKTDETAQEHFDNAKEHLGYFIIDSVTAGFEATHGIIGVFLAIKEISNASEHLIEACKEYNEGKKIEAETSSRQKDDYDASHDHDSWDRDY